MLQTTESTKIRNTDDQKAYKEAVLFCLKRRKGQKAIFYCVYAKILRGCLGSLALHVRSRLNMEKQA